MSVLEARDLRRHFGGVRAVDGVSFTVEAGERVALIGPNGAGKSTCFNLLNGQGEPDSGTVLLNGKDVTRLPPRERFRLGVGRTFQVAETFRSMTVRENLGVAGRSSHETEDFLKELQLLPLANQPCSTLSYGDLKRVELGLALAGKPRLLLMDEPTAGMASAERHALMALVKELSAKSGVAVLFTEHDMDVVFGFATRVLVMHQGRIIASGAPEAVRADPQVREVYLGAA
jgi:branched-chain amino acid transport system ATP-binding protein